MTINDKSVDGVFGTRTWGGGMVGTGISSELWWHPNKTNFRDDSYLTIFVRYFFLLLILIIIVKTAAYEIVVKRRMIVKRERERERERERVEMVFIASKDSHKRVRRIRRRT